MCKQPDRVTASNHSCLESTTNDPVQANPVTLCMDTCGQEERARGIMHPKSAPVACDSPCCTAHLVHFICVADSQREQHIQGVRVSGVGPGHGSNRLRNEKRSGADTDTDISGQAARDTNLTPVQVCCFACFLRERVKCFGPLTLVPCKGRKLMLIGAYTWAASLVCDSDMLKMHALCRRFQLSWLYERQDKASS